ncbi:metal-sensing transcriptional repressor [Tissierella sp.]|uniref:metal-sensing transcriptional repressor n=1 Tax=Tissierella sp. TaxID=41274 RepID=UPI002861C829|nr:metal-sensing transcriptional repressor [Tissierella sp.]MDR7854986.1 metal-sensing transcriptional repressor [Tissierella sp.]
MNAEKKKALQSLKTAKGQIEATIKMLEDDRYCVDISNQILAAQSLLKKADLLIIKQHMNHCVRQAFEQDNGDEKLEEVMDLLAKVIGK